jgi:hypothetical protein
MFKKQINILHHSFDGREMTAWTARLSMSAGIGTKKNISLFAKSFSHMFVPACMFAKPVNQANYSFGRLRRWFPTLCEYVGSII